MPRLIHARDVEEHHWLTTRDVARMLDVTPRWVRGLAYQGRLPFEHAHSGQRFYRVDAVLRLVRQRATARLRRRSDLLAAVHTQMVRARLDARFGQRVWASEPQQAPLKIARAS